LTIYLVQHGKSVSKEEDPDRPLSDIGNEEVKKIASGLKEYNISIESDIYPTPFVIPL
jgi:phosphohistidine phosphatase